jgi:PAS domain S-box-containing protein
MSNIELQPARPESIPPTQSLPHDRLFLAFIENLPGAAWIKDLEGRYLFANEQVAMASRLPVQEMLGKTDAQLVPGETATLFKESDAEVLRKDQPVELVQTISLNGQLRHLFVAKFPIRGDDGKPRMIGGFGVDITEMTKTKEALEQSEQKIRSLLDATTDLVFLIDRAGKVLLINTHGAKHLGKRPEEIEGTNCYALIPPEAAAARRGQIERAIQTAQPVRFEDARNGVFFDNRIFPLLDSCSEVAQIAIFATDITERKRAEETFRESEQRTRVVLNATTESVFLIDLEGKIILANLTGAARLGKRPEELEGTNVYSLFPPELAASRREHGQKVIRSGQPFRFEDPRADRIFDSCVYPLLNARSEVTHLVIFASDITERKRTEHALRESEERSRRLVNLSPIMIGVAVDEKVAFINEAGAAMLGATSAEQLIGRPVIELVHPASRELAARNIQRLLQASTPVNLGVETWQKLDGTPIQVELRAFLFRYQDVPAIYIVAEDVTDRMEAEEKLKTYAAQLHLLSQQLVEAQENERRHLARELHDEVGQALTAIQISLQSALRQPAPAAPSAPLQESLRLVEDLVRKTQDLSLSLRPTLLDDLGLPAVLRWYTSQQAARAGLHADFWASPLESRLDPALETACFRVAQEALTNVVRHAQAGEVTVQLLREDTSLHLVIHDDGKGFDVPAFLARTGTDTCIGLLGMQERVALVGGRFECKSSPQSGTEVHAWFPLAWRAIPPAPSPA